MSRGMGLLMLGVLAFAAPVSHADPADERVEAYLRTHRMDQLLEVQLEARLEDAEGNEQRAEIGAALADLYLRQLREIDREDPYRAVVLLKARSLTERLNAEPLQELRLELLIERYLAQEDAVELHRLLLLDDDRRRIASDEMSRISKELDRLLGEIKPQLARLSRDRTRVAVRSRQQEMDAEMDELRRLSSLAHYYRGWAGYARAVLTDQRVDQDSFIAFGWLLGAEDELPQSKDLPQAAVEYEHVARAAIGVAMCYAQSEDWSLAKTWLDTLIEDESTNASARADARGRLLRVLAMSGAWYDASVLAHSIIARPDAGALSVADARFVTITALGHRGGRQEEYRAQLIRLSIDQLIAHREIGHVVDLYKRFEDIPILREGFVPNYALALAELEEAERVGTPSSYLAVGERFSAALKTPDADEYPIQRDDCRLKLAYALIRADRPDDAIEHCDAILAASLDEQTLQEARWLRIGALDRINTLEGRSTSPELDDAVREYAATYPATPRTARLVLRHAMTGVIDERTAIETLSALDDDDPMVLPARRTLLQLRYRLLRKAQFNDPRALSEARELARWLVARHEHASETESTARTRASVLQIAIDLALRDDPPDTPRARTLIEQARALVVLDGELSPLEGELLTQLVRTEVIDDRIDAALAGIDELHAIDEARADEARLFVLDALVRQWSIAHSPRVAQYLIDVGSPVIARIAPGGDAPIPLQASAIMEVVADAANTLGEERNDEGMHRLAYRLCVQVLQRGQPSEPGLRRTASLAARFADQPTRLEAWLRLLAAYPEEDERWYEARYRSLEAMLRVDPERALKTYQQFKVLNPDLGPEPWNGLIAALFNDQVPGVNDEGGSRP